MAVLIDTNILVALSFPKAPHHSLARITMRDLKDKRIVVAPVLPEAFYMVATRVGYAQARQMFNMLRSTAFRIEPITDGDMARMDAIMAQYEDNAFDFVDTAIMAVAERLGITDVYTLDRRDFSVFRPTHCPALTLLPVLS